MNTPCTENLCSKEASNRVSYGISMPRRYFDMHQSSIEISVIAGNQTVIMVPMDVDNDGRLDLVL